MCARVCARVRGGRRRVCYALPPPLLAAPIRYGKKGARSERSADGADGADEDAAERGSHRRGMNVRLRHAFDVATGASVACSAALCGVSVGLWTGSIVFGLAVSAVTIMSSVLGIELSIRLSNGIERRRARRRVSVEL